MTGFRVIAWDLEVGEIPDFEKLLREPYYIPITCIAVCDGVNGQVETWPKSAQDAKEALTYEDLRPFLLNLVEMTLGKAGYYSVVFNGVNFDWKVLDLALQHFAHDDPRANDARGYLHRMALERTIDPAQIMVWHMGYSVSLAAMAEALGVPGKLEGTSGKDAPELWAQGEYDRVLQYVERDALCAYDVYEQLVITKHLPSWVNRHGKRTSAKWDGFWTCRVDDEERMMTVQDTLDYRIPEVSNPFRRRQDIIGWLTDQT